GRGGERPAQRLPPRRRARSAGDGRGRWLRPSAADRSRALRPRDRQHPRGSADRAGGRLRRRGRATRPLAARRLADHAGARRARRVPHGRVPSRRAAGQRRLVDPVAAAARRLTRALGAVLAGVAFALAAYALAGWIGSSVPRNPGWKEPREGIEILLGTNGVHTELVLPLVTPEMDWRPVFPAADVAAPDRGYTHVAVSWGEKEVFLNTPTWADLSPVTVLRIVG